MFRLHSNGIVFQQQHNLKNLKRSLHQSQDPINIDNINTNNNNNNSSITMNNRTPPFHANGAPAVQTPTTITTSSVHTPRLLLAKKRIRIDTDPWDDDDEISSTKPSSIEHFTSLHEAVEDLNRSNYFTDFSMYSCVQLFEHYVDISRQAHYNNSNNSNSNNNGNVLTGLGLHKFCEDLGVGTKSLSYFVSMYCLKCQSANQITRSEWCFAMHELKCDTLEKLRSRLPEFEQEILGDEQKFKEFFAFLFSFAKKDSKSRTLDVNTACEVLGKTVRDRSPFTSTFIEFLQCASEQRRVHSLNQDQWRLFLEFSQSIKPDFSNHKAEDAWPLLYDEFVAWAKKNHRGMMHHHSPTTTTF